MTEEWKDITGYEGYYQISNTGKIRSLRRYVNAPQGKRVAYSKELSPTDNGNGYLIIGLRKYGKRKNHYIHRLVARHFLGEWQEGLVVDHIDYNKRNNSVSNLRVVSQTENVRHSSDFMHKPHKSWKKNAHKYIYKRGNRFRVAIKGVCDKTFGTLDEALEFKKERLDERLS